MTPWFTKSNPKCMLVASMPMDCHFRFASLIFNYVSSMFQFFRDIGNSLKKFI